jgi:hypothetical protein
MWIQGLLEFIKNVIFNLKYLIRISWLKHYKYSRLKPFISINNETQWIKNVICIFKGQVDLYLDQI